MNKPDYRKSLFMGEVSYFGIRTTITRDDKGNISRVKMERIPHSRDKKPRPLPTIEFPWPERDDGGSK